MKCAINNTIDQSLKKGKRMDVVRRSIRMRYRVSIDATAFKERIRPIGVHYNLAS